MNEQRAQDALRHLQTAAVEMIEAARAALEVVEDIVRDPSALTTLIAAAQAAAQPAGGDPAWPPADDDDGPAGEGRASRVTRINVS